MEYSPLIKKIVAHHKKKLPFSLYSLPGSKEISCYLQNDDEAYNCESFLEKGIVFAPFNSEEPKYFLPSDRSTGIQATFPVENLPLDEIDIPLDEEAHQKHLNLVEKAKSRIEKDDARKIVVSLRKDMALEKLDLEAIIYRLLNLFPEAFRYVWFHSKTGLWFGASPELLVKTDGIAFSTMSVAGTQKLLGDYDPEWTPKELIEQQYVTDAITESLQKVTSIMKISKTKTHKAGSIAHLRTDITGILKKGKTTLAGVSQTLHPTPAVCGTPQNYAKEFILENEGYDREFYTGYVGPIAQKEMQSSLYVNLRCVKIVDNQASFYVGGGITSDSVAKDEWIETQNKLQIMLQVLRPFLK